MQSKQILAAVLATAGAATAATNCTATTFTINSQADFDVYADCETLTGNVVFGTATDASIDISGPTKIDGGLSVLNNPSITTLTSTSLTSITGAFHLQNLTALSTLSFSDLTSTGSISWTSLTALDVITFTAGVDTADSITISDTFLSSLDGIDVTSATSIDINNNRRLVSYTSSLGNLSSLLNMNANGADLEVSFPELIWIANMTISNVSSFSVPKLQTVNGSIRFDSNFFTEFTAPNLTSTVSGDISFVSNADAANITMPLLTSVGGGFQIANNTALEKINGFASLKSVGGAIILRGNFSDVELPALSDVKGAVSIISTTDITDSCTTLKKLAPSSQGGNGDIQGTFTCSGEIADANSDTSTTATGTSSSSSTSSTASASSSSSSSAATGLSINALAVLALAGVAGLAQLL